MFEIIPFPEHCLLTIVKEKIVKKIKSMKKNSMHTMIAPDTTVLLNVFLTFEQYHLFFVKNVIRV